MSARADSLARLLERGHQQRAARVVNFLTASDAERMVKSLRAVRIHEIGSAEFLELHDTIEKLNIQAHHNAATHSDEFVADLLASHGKLDALVRGLLAAEAWREHVLPHLRPRLARGGRASADSADDNDDKGENNNNNDNDNNVCDSWVVYCALRHEAALANLLEVCLFRASGDDSAADGLLGEGEALELADWAVRRLRHLALVVAAAADDKGASSKGSSSNPKWCHPIALAGGWRRELLQKAGAGAGSGGGGGNAGASERVRALAAAARALLDAPPELEIEERIVETEFQAALCALGLTRWLADAACASSSGGGGGGVPRSLALLSRLVGRPSASGGDDAVTLLAELLDRPPWERPSEAPGAAVERYCCGGSGGGGGGGGGGSAAASADPSSSSSWSLLPAADRHRLAPQAAQAWLALCRLLCDPAARARWLAASGGGGAALAAMLRLRRPLASPLLLDQAPFLVPLARAVEGLAMGGGGGGGMGDMCGSAMMMVVEPLPGLREAVLLEGRKRAGAAAGGGGGGGSSGRRGEWGWALAEAQAAGAFSAGRSRAAAQARAASMAEAFEYMASMGGGGDDDEEEEEDQERSKGGRREAGGGKGKAAAPSAATAAATAQDEGAETAAHVTCWRQAGSDLWEPWCDFVYRLDAGKAAEEVTTGGGGGAGGGGGSGGNGDGDNAAAAPRPVLRGLRRRLLPVDPKLGARPFPCEGKVAVRVGDRVAEARLSLPPLHSRGEGGEGEGGAGGAGAGAGGGNGAGGEESGGPAAVWASVGDLARDGFVLQMRLARRPPAGRERDRSNGAWYAYAPAGGALTLPAA